MERCELIINLNIELGEEGWGGAILKLELQVVFLPIERMSHYVMLVTTYCTDGV